MKYAMILALAAAGWGQQIDLSVLDKLASRASEAAYVGPNSSSMKVQNWLSRTAVEYAPGRRRGHAQVGSSPACPLHVVKPPQKSARAEKYSGCVGHLP